MTEPIRGARARRGNRRPGWLLLTILLVLAIVASSVLVFTDKVELLKLAVIVSLWAAAVAAFASFVYRRQADLDQAKSRDLKLVYDLQLDREISARREYELVIESQLRRELASELRAETSDEVAALRAELAALRANLELIFDTDLQSRPALETERTAVHTFGDWVGNGRGDAAPERVEPGFGPGRVISSRIDTPEDPGTFDPNTEESPIIDVRAEPQPPDEQWAAQDPGGAHRRASERGSDADGWPATPPPPRPVATPEPEPAPEPEPEPEPVAAHVSTEPQWQPAPAEGSYIPAGRPGSNWATPEPEPPPAAEPEPAPPRDAPRMGRHSPPEPAASEHDGHARHASEASADRPVAAPALATPPAPEPDPEPRSARHRGDDDADEPAGQHVGGQPVAELMARLQVGSAGGGRRRRRDE